jgi:hypothetical protein
VGRAPQLSRADLRLLGWGAEGELEDKLDGGGGSGGGGGGGGGSRWTRGGWDVQMLQSGVKRGGGRGIERRVRGEAMGRRGRAGEQR